MLKVCDWGEISSGIIKWARLTFFPSQIWRFKVAEIVSMDCKAEMAGVDKSADGELPARWKGSSVEKLAVARECAELEAGTLLAGMLIA